MSEHHDHKDCNGHAHEPACCAGHGQAHALKPAEDEVTWRQHLGATLLCAGALAAAAIGEKVVGAGFATALYAVSFIAGLRYLLPATWASVRGGNIDVDFLMLLVAGGAWGLGHPGEGGMLLVLFSASRAMEAFARARTQSAISALALDLPAHATRIAEDGTRTDIDIKDIAAGDRLLIPPGERFPVDCTLPEGRATVDMSAITGESEPYDVPEGGEILSGAVNGQQLLEVIATRPASDSAYQKIMHLIENAPARRSPAQVLSDKVGRIFTKVILGATVLGFLVWWQVMKLPLDVASYRAMALLVAGSPCAVVLSIPSAILAAIASGARRGILFNGGVGLSALATVKIVAFDKTGTLTTGERGVEKMRGEAPGDPEMALALASSSTHPASRSIAKWLKAKGIVAAPGLEEIHERPGDGVFANAPGGEHVWLGRPRGCDAIVDPEQGLTRVMLYRGGQPRASFFLSEVIRTDAAEAVAGLKARGLTTRMLSGDVKTAVDRVAAAVGIDDARGELRPDDKFKAVRDAHDHGGVAMVGDGVNDAPAIAAATVGVAMGVRASAATLAQADIILVKDRLAALVSAVDLGRFAMKIVRQNLAISIGAASILVLFAMAGRLPLLLGVFGHEGGTVLVVLNSLRLLRK